MKNYIYSKDERPEEFPLEPEEDVEDKGTELFKGGNSGDNERTEKQQGNPA